MASFQITENGIITLDAPVAAPHERDSEVEQWVEVAKPLSEAALKSALYRLDAHVGNSSVEVGSWNYSLLAPGLIHTSDFAFKQGFPEVATLAAAALSSLQWYVAAERASRNL